MRPSPWADAAAFLTYPGVFTAAFWLLLALGVAVAVLAWRRVPAQRTARAAGVWLLRVVVGCMWWQQSLWKVPPDYGGLLHWMGEMVDHAAIPLQGRLVADYVIPGIGVFGPAVYGVEASIGVSLILGAFTRLAGLLGALMAVNLWLGLYSAPNEWPWTYMFLIVIQAHYVLDPPGRVLGVDALWGRLPGRERSAA